MSVEQNGLKFGVLGGHIGGTFDLLVFMVIFGVIWCTCLKNGLKQNRLAIEQQQGFIFGTQDNIRAYTGSIHIHAHGVQGLLLIIQCPCSKTVCNAKTAAVE